MSVAAPAPVFDRIAVRPAGAEDNRSLLALTRATPMAGTVALRIDRDPDFFGLQRLRGPGLVLVAERRREVVACVSVSFQEVYVGGTVQRAAYVADLKVHPRHSGGRAGVRLMDVLRSTIEDERVDLVWTVTADGNSGVIPFLEGRLGMPKFFSAGRFLVDQLPGFGFARRAGFEIAEASPGDRPSIAGLLEEFHRARELAPAGPREPQDAAATFVARRNGEVVATLELFDPAPVKRNVLLAAPLATRVALRLLRPVAVTPRVGEAVRLLYVRRLACHDGQLDALSALLRYARSLVFSRRMSFAAIGLHERDPLRPALRGMPRFSFTSQLFVASMHGSDSIRPVLTGVPFEDFALV